MKRLLWLDDIRNPYKGGWLYEFAPEYETTNSVFWVKNYNEFINWIKENGLPDMIGFDHDLGEDIAYELVKKGMSKKEAREIKKESLTGLDCAKWLVEYCMDNDVSLPKWVIQSANPVGKDNINGLLINFLKHHK
jgi:hypothetical protein